MYSTSFTGIGRYVHELTKHLFILRPDWHFTLFLSPEEYKAFPKDHANVSTICADEKHYSLGEQTSFLRKISRERYDLFHFPHFNAPLLYRGKSIVTIHDLTISFFPGKKKTSLLHKLGYKTVLSNIVRKSHKVIAVSGHTKSDLQHILKTAPEKIEVIWNGLGDDFLRGKQDTQKLETIRAKLFGEYSIQAPYFLYAGVHREHKNVVGMIRAFSQFSKHHPNAQLIITGKEDPFYPEIAEAIAKENLEHNIKRVGLVSEDELKTLLFYAHGFVFPSFYEGFGLPPLEAMAMEIPIISSNTSAMPEICGDAVEYFDPYNVEEIWEKMELIFQNTKRRTELIAKGKERIRMFSWEKMAQQTAKAYEEVLERG